MVRNGDTVEHHKDQGQCGVFEKQVGKMPTSLECLTTSKSLEPQLRGQINDFREAVHIPPFTIC